MSAGGLDGVGGGSGMRLDLDPAAPKTLTGSRGGAVGSQAFTENAASYPSAATSSYTTVGATRFHRWPGSSARPIGAAMKR